MAFNVRGLGQQIVDIQGVVSAAILSPIIDCQEFNYVTPVAIYQAGSTGAAFTTSLISDDGTGTISLSSNAVTASGIFHAMGPGVTFGISPFAVGPPRRLQWGIGSIATGLYRLLVFAR